MLLASLGTFVKVDGDTYEKVKTRINKALVAFSQLPRAWQSNVLPQKTIIYSKV